MLSRLTMAWPSRRTAVTVFLISSRSPDTAMAGATRPIAVIAMQSASRLFPVRCVGAVKPKSGAAASKRLWSALSIAATKRSYLQAATKGNLGIWF